MTYQTTVSRRLSYALDARNDKGQQPCSVAPKTASPWKPAAMLLVLSLAGCASPATPSNDAANDSSNDGATDANTDTAIDTITGGGTSDTNDGDAGETSGAELPDLPPTETTSGAEGLDTSFDGGDYPLPPVRESCDFWAQDCDEGEKCTPVATYSKWNEHYCVPAGTEPPGSPCTRVEGDLKGQDTCDATSMCYDLDEDTGVGTCLELCVGTPESNSCPQTGNDCLQLNDGILNICPPGCNPLVPGTCPPGQNCVAGVEGGTVESFLCFPPAAEGITGDECECANCCADGHMCTDAATYGQGCTFDLCCTEYCDVSDAAFTCAGEDQLCVALFDATHPTYAQVGACQLPM